MSLCCCCCCCCFCCNNDEASLHKKKIIKKNQKFLKKPFLTFPQGFSIPLTSVVAVVVRVFPDSSNQDTVVYRSLLRYFHYFGTRLPIKRPAKMILVSKRSVTFDSNSDGTWTIYSIFFYQKIIKKIKSCVFYLENPVCP